MFKIFKAIGILSILISFHLALIPGVCFGDESEIFATAVKPDALFVLDMSDSMKRDPNGISCSSSSITNPCKKVDIAKRAIRDLLDADSSGTVVSPTDDNIHKIRFGYMVFNGEDSAGNPLSGSIIKKKDIGSSYSSIWTLLVDESNSSGTPLIWALREAKTYLDQNPPEQGAECRSRFVILLSDGNETKFTCGGSKADNPQRNHGVVSAAKALADAGYKLIVITFGGEYSPEDLVVLEWAAYYGGTDNPAVANTGNPAAFTPRADPCSAPDSEDPATKPLSGYYFRALDMNQLKDALLKAIGIIKASTYSFSVTSVVASRTSAENYIYEASFKTSSSGPFWQGFLRKYSLDINGNAIIPSVWDAGSVLKDRTASTRNMFTYQKISSISASLTDFLVGDPEIKKKDLDVSTGALALQVAGYIRGEATYKPDLWKLGDVFHSSPILIGSPSAYFVDARSPKAFSDFRTLYAGREKVIVVGANDGQLHAFQAGSTADPVGNGSEKWSFIPPNLLAKLQYLALKTAPTHTYFVDGPVTVADVWLGAGDGRNKSSADWRTLMIFGEGKGVRDQNNDVNNPQYLWSSSEFCASDSPKTDFSKDFTLAKYKYYCGYYAFDVTDPSVSRPAYRWPHGRLNLTDPANQGPYLGEPWSKMAIGRVVINGDTEKWVGFIGGGYSTGATSGKGFFVVDLSNGDILWSFTNANLPAKMTYAIPASPVVVDTDNDGFIDTAYVGDLGGNMWRFKFCLQADGTNCNTGNWSGGLLFDSSVGTDSGGNGLIQPIYTTATVARSSGSLWVFWGTGDKEGVQGTSGKNHFFALKDDDRSTTRSISDFQDVTAVGAIYTGTTAGWYVTLNSSGEKVLFDPTVFGGMALFTTYTPSASADSCSQGGGTSRLYAIAMTRLAIGSYKYDPGAGLLSTPSSGDTTDTKGGAKSVILGTGMAKNPILSQKPLPASGATDLYVSISGGEAQDVRIISSSQLGDNPLTQHLVQTAPSSQLLHWRDGRIQ